MMAAVLLVGGLVVVPGAGASLALAPPGAITVEGRIGLVFGLGYGVVAGVATALALAHVFSRPAFIVGVILATIGVWLLALRRAPAREHAAKLAEQARETPFVLGAGLALLLAVAVSRLFYPSENSLAIRSAWRYWSDGLEAASAGHIPTTAAQWGTRSRDDQQARAQQLRGRRLLLPRAAAAPRHARDPDDHRDRRRRGAPRPCPRARADVTAPLVPVLVILVPDRLPLSHEITGDLKLYTGEGVGRLAAFSAVLIGIYALRGRERWAPAIVAGALLALAGLTHLVPTLIAGALLALFAIAFVLVDRSCLKTALVRGGVAALAFAVCYAGMTVLSGGDLGLQRATSHASFSGLPPKVDPTLSFSHGKYVDLEPKHGHFFIPPREIVGRYAEDTIDRPTYGKVGLGFLAVLFVASVVAAWFERRLFIVLTVAWGLAGTILTVALLFSYRYDTLIPANFGRAAAVRLRRHPARARDSRAHRGCRGAIRSP